MDDWIQVLPKENKVFFQHVSKLQKNRKITPRIAGNITLTLLFLWQKQGFPKLQPTTIHGMKKYISDPLVQALVNWITVRPFLEATFWLSSAYSLLVGNEHQSKYAMYFTPPALADRLIDNLLNAGASLRNQTWKDPACGGGAFLTPVAIRMIDELAKSGVEAKALVKIVAKNLVGNDIDQILATLSKNFILMAMYEHICRANFIPALRISVSDSLQSIELTEVADVIVCNPPYRKMTRLEVDTYRQDFEDIIEGQPNLYGLFMRRCLTFVNPSGLIGLLTPTSYLSGQNFSKLRQTILERSSVLRIDLLRQKEGIFLRVEQETALSIFEAHNKKPSKTGAASVSILEGDKFKDVGTFSTPGKGSAWHIPRDVGDARILQHAGKGKFRLADYGYTARTGAYVFYRDERSTFKKRPTGKAGVTVFPLIWSSDITTDEKLIHGRENKQEKRDKFIDMSTLDHSSIVKLPCVALQRITSADQGRRLVGAAVPENLRKLSGGVVGENHVVFLEKTTDASTITPHQLVSILGSITVDRLFRCISGAVNVSIFELNQLSLPPPEIVGAYLASEEYTVDEAVELAFEDLSRSMQTFSLKNKSV